MSLPNEAEHGREAHHRVEDQASRNEVAHARMAHTAFEGVRQNGEDFIIDVQAAYGEYDPAAVPDTLVVPAEDLHVPKMRPSYYSVDYTRTPIYPWQQYGEPLETASVQPVMRMHAERREQVAVQYGEWGDADKIARLTNVPLSVIERFIDKNRAKLGNVFAAPELRRRIVDGATTEQLTEHYSPQFIEWAVASLQAALARYESERSSRPNLES